MHRLVLTVGLPGCLKTTKARAWRERNPARLLLSRDDFRAMLRGDDGRRHADVDPDEDARVERIITGMQHTALRIALAAEREVMVHDTNLNPDYRLPLIRIAAECGARVDAWDFTSADPRACIERVERRRIEGGRWVPADVIIDLYQQWIMSGRANPAWQPGISKVITIPTPNAVTAEALDRFLTHPLDAVTVDALREHYGRS